MHIFLHTKPEIFMERFYSDFVFSTPSYLTGAGTVFNIAGNYYRYNRSVTPAQADARAIRQDFAMIGQDVCDTVKALEKEKSKQLPLGL